MQAANKAYVYLIKYKTATGNIPNTVMTDHTLFSFPAANAFANGNIKICEMLVKRLAHEWIATSSPMHCSQLSGQAFTRSQDVRPLLHSFLVPLLVAGLAIFVSTTYSYREYIISTVI